MESHHPLRSFDMTITAIATRVGRLALRTQVFLVLVGLILVVIGWAAYPGRFVYWRSEVEIRQFLLQETPIGASREEVLERLDSERAFIESPRSADRFSTVLAHYRTPAATYVQAFCDFDSSGRLVGIRVQRSVDVI
jgi:hypothetical protein